MAVRKSSTSSSGNNGGIGSLIKKALFWGVLLCASFTVGMLVISPLISSISGQQSQKNTSASSDAAVNPSDTTSAPAQPVSPPQSVQPPAQPSSPPAVSSNSSAAPDISITPVRGSAGNTQSSESPDSSNASSGSASRNPDASASSKSDTSQTPVRHTTRRRRHHASHRTVSPSATDNSAAPSQPIQLPGSIDGSQ